MITPLGYLWANNGYSLVSNFDPSCKIKPCGTLLVGHGRGTPTKEAKRLTLSWVELRIFVQPLIVKTQTVCVLLVGPHCRYKSPRLYEPLGGGGEGLGR